MFPFAGELKILFRGLFGEAQSKDLVKIYGLVFGNLLIVLAVQTFILLVLEPTYEDPAALYLAHFCVLIVLLIGILMVAMFLRRNIVPFFWVGTQQMNQAMHGSPNLWPPGYSPYPRGRPHQAPVRGPVPRGHRPPPPKGRHPPGGPEGYAPHTHETTRPQGMAKPHQYAPLSSSHPTLKEEQVPHEKKEEQVPEDQSPQSNEAKGRTSKTSEKEGPGAAENGQDKAPEDGPYYKRYNRNLHYAPQYHGPRYYQSRHQTQVANVRPAYYRSGVYGSPQTGETQQTKTKPRQKGTRQRMALPRKVEGDSETVPYQKGPLLGLEIREALHLPAFRYLFAIFVASLVAGFLILQQDKLWIKAVIFPIAFIIAFSFPSLMWISYIYNRTSERPAPQRLVFIALSWGMISTIPSMIFNTVGAYMLGADLELLLEGEQIGAAEFATVALIAPIVEELFKPLGLLLIFRRLESGYSGVLYGVTCGMGFALVENMSYELLVLVGSDVDTVWTATSFVRGVGSTLLHAVGPALVGYYMACARFKGCDRHMVFVAYLMAILLHGSWNSAATLGLVFPDVEIITAIEIIALLGLFVACLLILRALLSVSIAQQESMVASPPHLQGRGRRPPPRQPPFQPRPPNRPPGTAPPRQGPPQGPPPGRGPPPDRATP